MFFLEKRADDFPKHIQCVTHRIHFTGSASSRRQNPDVVKTDQNHNTRTHQHDNHPGMYHSKFILQHTCQPNQASVGKYLGQIIKSSLPTKKVGQRQRKCYQCKCQSGNDFRSDNKVFFRFKHFQKRTP